ncbi:MAG: helix-turn-helix transcriptional regulator [Oscillospiraceae bacterium]
MEIGKKIRELRIARNLTQEALAAELSVTPQAISKWECGTTTPDIQLLPDIAIFFGVTLDELFCLTDDNELDRIQNQIWDSRLLPQAELERAERFLQSRIEAGYRPGRCWCLRAQLHNHQAQQHHALAAEYARQALAVSPTEKDVPQRALRGDRRHVWRLVRAQSRPAYRLLLRIRRGAPGLPARLSLTA